MTYAEPQTKPLAVGCVSYLNATPLIDGFAEALPQTQLVLDVPAKQIDLLDAGRVDLALCPVIDYFRSPRELRVVPVGGIGCVGPTQTVRLFSPVPPADITHVHLDAESHTSVCLLRVILNDVYGVQPPVSVGLPKPTAPRQPGAARLLIGDKVVTHAPAQADFPYQIDLGDAWHRLTGQPFVFAVWLARHNASLANLPQALAQLLEHNLKRIDTIAATHGPRHGWPVALAADYLGNILHYRVGKPELDAIGRFAQRAATLNLIPPPARALITFP
ncbi:MAG: menaquinone biosynthesis protein [Algisphaera sp.]